MRALEVPHVPGRASIWICSAVPCASIELKAIDSECHLPQPARRLRNRRAQGGDRGLREPCTTSRSSKETRSAISCSAASVRSRSRRSTRPATCCSAHRSRTTSRLVSISDGATPGDGGRGSAAEGLHERRHGRPAAAGDGRVPRVGRADKHLKSCAWRCGDRSKHRARKCCDCFPTARASASRDGGFVLWIQLPPATTASRSSARLAPLGINILPGTVFSPSKQYATASASRAAIRSRC